MSDHAGTPVTQREFYGALSLVFSTIFVVFLAVILIHDDLFETIVLLQIIACDLYYGVKSMRTRSKEPVGSRA